MIGTGTLIVFGLIFLGILFVRPFRPKELSYFTLKEMLKHIPETAKKYKWHMLFFAVIYFEKNYIDKLNDPIRYGLGLDFTYLLMDLEGGFIHYLQQGVAQTPAVFFDPFTFVVGTLYITGYIFINYFSVTFFALLDRKRLANKMVLNYMMIYFISIPFYLFTPVDVTGQVHPEMNTLLYDMSPFYHQFFSAVDPFDNCVPSLHIAIPFGMMLIMWRHHRKTKKWEFKRFFGLLVGLNIFFAFAIIFLGIHWYMDIVIGILIGLFGVFIVERVEPGIWKKIDRVEPNLHVYLKMVQPKSKPKFMELRRFVAFLIDIGLIIIGPLLYFGIPDSYWIPDEPALIAMLIIAFLYWTMMELIFHTTVGKIIVRLKIVDTFNTPTRELPESLLEEKNGIGPEAEKRSAIGDSYYIFGIFLDILLVFVPAYIIMGMLPVFEDHVLVPFVLASSVFFTYYFITRLLFSFGLGGLIVRKVLSLMSDRALITYGHVFTHARRTVFKTFTFLVIVDAIADLLIKLIFRGKGSHIHQMYRNKKKKEGED